MMKHHYVEQVHLLYCESDLNLSKELPKTGLVAPVIPFS